MTAIISATKDSMVPGYFSIAASIITLVTVFFLRETKGQELISH
jgi:MHS family proline/betaine transporter-like MFS transporter